MEWLNGLLISNLFHRVKRGRGKTCSLHFVGEDRPDVGSFEARLIVEQGEDILAERSHQPTVHAIRELLPPGRLHRKMSCGSVEIEGPVASTSQAFTLDRRHEQIVRTTDEQAGAWHHLRQPLCPVEERPQEPPGIRAQATRLAGQPREHQTRRPASRRLHASSKNARRPELRMSEHPQISAVEACQERRDGDDGWRRNSRRELRRDHYTGIMRQEHWRGW